LGRSRPCMTTKAFGIFHDGHTSTVICLRFCWKYQNTS
jgi:hypothetical protein